MITRMQIEEEAAFIQALIKRATNPTGIKHTPTPWLAEGETGRVISGDETGMFIGFFRRPEDRDLAVYFVNSHASMLSVIEQLAGSLEFIARSIEDEGTRKFAQDRAELARVYAGIFTRLGKIEGKVEEHDGAG